MIEFDRIIAWRRLFQQVLDFLHVWLFFFIIYRWRSAPPCPTKTNDEAGQLHFCPETAGAAPICWSGPGSCPDNNPTSPTRTNQNTHYCRAAVGGEVEASEEEKRERRMRICCRRKWRSSRRRKKCWASTAQKAKVIKWCVVYVDHPHGTLFSLLYCFHCRASADCAAATIDCSLTKQGGAMGRRWCCVEQWLMK